MLNTQAQIELYQAAQRRQMEEQQKAAQRKAMGKLLTNVFSGGGSGAGVNAAMGSGTTAAGATSLGSGATSGLALPSLAPMAPTAASTSAAAAPAMGFSAGAAASVAAPLALYALATAPGGFGTADTTPRPWDPNRALKELDAFNLAPGLSNLSQADQVDFVNSHKDFIGYRGAGVKGEDGKPQDIADIERSFPTSAWKVYRPNALGIPHQKDKSDQRYQEQNLLKQIDPENWMKYGSGEGVTDWRRVPLETQAKAVMQDPRMSEKYKGSIKKLMEDYNQKNTPPPAPKPTRDNINLWNK